MLVASAAAPVLGTFVLLFAAPGGSVARRMKSRWPRPLLTLSQYPPDAVLRRAAALGTNSIRKAGDYSLSARPWKPCR
jgi:hypothetical protein